ncbi:hypothetical protein [Galbibacter pacificus]|uniref:GLPGLI family protein n=1 Tax=Galbibacter pacificus TaxID=2996052 RepID=A0ABT6FWI5_9FLAO|nr:hypothetical protein [Galbibacter pacificus]MDG3583955.1 hypothetical protein [Galbibacter pacificus]MDG3587607.1 hypothetical protein [Galbibacter pacificus]
MKITYRILYVLFLIIACNGALAQSTTKHQSVLYINVIINYEGKIKIKDNVLNLNEVQVYTRNYVRQQPAFKYNGVVYRVYADEDLELGTIMDLEQELQKAFEGKRERYLLNTKTVTLDEPDLWNKLKTLEIKAVKD